MTYLVPGGADKQPVRVDAATWGVAPGRTYIIPDDWYANHGLAPGDARLPQKPLEQGGASDAAWGDGTSGRLVPTPPMRGYFGRPPYPLPRPLPPGLKTRSPFAVSDVMWGMHGLAGNDPKIDAVLAKMKKQMRNIAIEQAAISSSISIALLVVPVVGQVASAFYGIIQLVVGSQNKLEVQSILADTQEKAKAIVAKYNLKLSDAQDRVWDAEANGAAQLAVSCTDLQGLGGWFGNILSNFGIKNIVRKSALYVVNPIAPLVKPAQKLLNKAAPKAVSHVTDQAIAKPTAQMEKNVNTAVDVLSGQEAVKKAKAARTKVLAEVETSSVSQYKKAVVAMDTPVFRANLRKQLAIKLRSEPSILATLTQQCAVLPTTGRGVDPRTGIPYAKVDESIPAAAKAAPWAGLAAAGAVMLVLGLGHK